MKKRMLLVVSLALCVCLLGGCALVPISGLSGMLPRDDTPVVPAATATATREVNIGNGVIK